MAYLHAQCAHMHWRGAARGIIRMRSPSKPTEFVNSLCASKCYVNAQHTSYTDDELICQLVVAINTKKRLVVLTTKWLPWLHSLCWYQRLIV